MSIITWSDELSVGIESIDKQHKVLIRLINSLNTAMAEGETNIIIAEILLSLADYTKDHFAYEEMLFDQYDYPQSIEHKAQHQDLIAQILVLKDRFEADLSGSLCIEIMQFLKNWLTHHIQKTDKSYADYLIAKGVR